MGRLTRRLPTKARPALAAPAAPATTADGATLVRRRLLDGITQARRRSARVTADALNALGRQADNPRTESTDSPRVERACLRDVLPATAGNCR